MDVIGIGSRPAFHHMQSIAVRIGVLVDPDLFVFETDGIDHQRVAFPMADLFAEERRIRIFGMLPAVGRDQAIVTVEIKERDELRSLQNAEGKAAGVVTRDSADDAERFRVDGLGQVECKRPRPPAVSGSLNPGRSLPILPTGLVVRSPFQKPVRSG